MKKRITSLLLAAMLLITLVAFVGCGEKGTQYKYSKIFYGDYVPTVDDTTQSIYERAVLIINDDGTWKLAVNVVSSINIDIYKGTYTFEDDCYVFDGFDSEYPVIGYESKDLFQLCFTLSEEGTGVDFVILFTKV